MFFIFILIFFWLALNICFNLYIHKNPNPHIAVNAYLGFSVRANITVNCSSKVYVYICQEMSMQKKTSILVKG